jgi:hypothetical protein
MARTGFDLSTIVKIADASLATGALAKAKDKQFHHNLMLGRLIEVGECTCKELEAWLEGEKATLMDEAHRGPWDKYSAACHMAYFVNRFRGAITAWKADGTQVAQTATKVKKAKAEEVAAPEAAPVEEVADAVTADLEAALG